MKFIEKFKKVINTKIGYWTITDAPHQKRKGAYYVYCICVCGTKQWVNFHSIIGGRSTCCKSCACKIYDKFAPLKKWINKNGPPAQKPTGVAAFNEIYNVYRSSARSRKKSFTLSKDDFRYITQQNCHYCGSPPSKSSSNRKTNLNGAYVYSGIDRKDNNLGYTIENSLPCCEACNFLKKDINYDEFLKMIFKIGSNLKNEKNT